MHKKICRNFLFGNFLLMGLISFAFSAYFSIQVNFYWFLGSLFFILTSLQLIKALKVMDLQQEFTQKVLFFNILIGLQAIVIGAFLYISEKQLSLLLISSLLVTSCLVGTIIFYLGEDAPRTSDRS